MDISKVAEFLKNFSVEHNVCGLRHISYTFLAIELGIPPREIREYGYDLVDALIDYDEVIDADYNDEGIDIRLREVNE